MHLTDIVRPGRDLEQEKAPGVKFSNILNLLFLIAIFALLIYELITLGPTELLDRITTFPQWFPQVFEYWFENNIYPVLEPLVGKFAK